MKLMTLILGLTLVGAAGVAPQVSLAAANPSSCNSPRSDFDSLYCENKVFMQADTDLNAAYGKLRARLKPSDQATLKSGQLAWIRQRNTQCSRTESSGIMVNLDCANQKTIQRTNWLSERLRECTSSGCRSQRLSD
jgi:uncharacterized protein YecT (DUF1311 family)